VKGPVRPYASEFYSRELHEDACPVCGCQYAKDLPSDRKLHRSIHARNLSVFEPRPNKALAKRHAQSGPYIRVTAGSPKWMHRRLVLIATMFKREFGCDFVMWDESGDDCKGFIFADQDGRARGGCALKWREWSNSAPAWALQWIWVAPPYRRRGILREAWCMLTKEFAGVIPEWPYSPAMAQFLLSCNDLPEVVRRYAIDALKKT